MISIPESSKCIFEIDIRSLLFWAKELKQDEAMHRRRAEMKREEKRRVEECKEITRQDLTWGVIQYKRLGCDVIGINQQITR